jgi:hypothetical protein
MMASTAARHVKAPAKQSRSIATAATTPVRAISKIEIEGKPQSGTKSTKDAASGLALFVSFVPFCG